MNGPLSCCAGSGVMDNIGCTSNVALVSVVMDGLSKSVARVMATFTLALAEVGVDVLMLGQVNC